jgi:hypothetical protein
VAQVPPTPTAAGPPVSPTRAPSPSTAPTALPQATPGQTATAQSLPGLTTAAELSPSPAAAAFRTVLDERFADRQEIWPDDPRGTAWFADGTYRLAARQPGHFVAVSAPIAEPLRDAVVMGRFRKIGGPPGGGYGLIARVQEPRPRGGTDQSGRFYVFEVGDRGEVGVWRREGERWVDLVPWTRSEAVRPGSGVNELTARAIRQHLTFLVNGVLVADLEDPVLSQGAVGVFVGGDLNEVVLERFAVQVPS